MDQRQVCGSGYLGCRSVSVIRGGERANERLLYVVARSDVVRVLLTLFVSFVFFSVGGDVSTAITGRKPAFFFFFFFPIFI